MFNKVDHPFLWASSLSLLASVSLWFLVGRRAAASGRRSAPSLPETLVSASSATRSMARAEDVHIQFPTWTVRNLQATSEPRGRMELKPASPADEVPGYTQLQRQIHHALRAQHPEWLQPNGDSPVCDSYESRFAELLRTLTWENRAESGGRRISNRSVSFFTRPDESRPDRFSQSLNNHVVSRVVQGTTSELK